MATTSKSSLAVTGKDVDTQRPDSKDGRSINAPEVDTSVLAPQICTSPEEFGQSPRFFWNNVSLLPHPDDTFPKEWVSDREVDEVDDSHTTGTGQPVAKSRLFRQRKWLIVAASIVAIAIALGIGLGYGFRPDPSKLGSTYRPSPPQPTHGALNDTSFAAISNVQGERHLLFQDLNSTIRYMVYSPTIDTWSDVRYIITDRQPRLHTPLAIDFPATIPADPYAMVAYVDTNNNLAMIEFSTDNRGDVTPASVINETFPVSPDSRSLTLSRLHWNSNLTQEDVRNGQTQPWQEWLLLYTSPSNNITFLYGYTYLSQDNSSSGNALWTWEWQNISQPFYEQNNPDGWLSEPFFGGRYGVGPDFGGYLFNPQFESDTSTYPFVDLKIKNLSSIGNGSQVLNTVYLPGARPPPNGEGPNTPLSWTTMTPYPANETGNTDAVADRTGSILNYGGDIAMVDRNGTLYIANHAMPNLTFPFGRISSAYTNDTVFIYHQLNESVLLEETGDTMIGFGGFGKTKQIPIPTQ